MTRRRGEIVSVHGVLVLLSKCEGWRRRTSRAEPEPSRGRVRSILVHRSGPAARRRPGDECRVQRARSNSDSASDRRMRWRSREEHLWRWLLSPLSGTWWRRAAIDGRAIVDEADVDESGYRTRPASPAFAIWLCSSRSQDEFDGANCGGGGAGAGATRAVRRWTAR